MGQQLRRYEVTCRQVTDQNTWSIDGGVQHFEAFANAIYEQHCRDHPLSTRTQGEIRAMVMARLRRGLDNSSDAVFEYTRGGLELIAYKSGQVCIPQSRPWKEKKLLH